MENAEVVREAYRRFSPDQLGPWAELWHEDALSTAAEGWPEPGPFIGRDAIVAQFENLFADWSEYEFKDVEVVAESGPWVVATWRLFTRGAASGLETELGLAAAYRVDDGRIMEGHFRWNQDEALEAAGLGHKRDA